MTTASDVYSLGIVLYELSTGHSPYKLNSTSPQELVHAICTGEVQKPSLAIYRVDSSKDAASRLHIRDELSMLRSSSPDKLRKHLDGDLDNILLMALQKDPARRYRSAEQFQEDIRRHLENLPIVARKDTAWYRASKFANRHKAGVIFSAALALALLAGMAITLHEAKVARFERARAELRFNDVRKLANSLMFEVHDSIRDLAGATAARKLIVNRALEYLDSLSKEASGDVALQRELAAAYDRVGDLMGYSGAANLGDPAGALKSYQKALAIREISARANPDDPSVQSDLLNEYFRLSFALLDTGDFTAALKVLQAGLPIAKKLAASQSDPKYKDYLAVSTGKRGAYRIKLVISQAPQTAFALPLQFASLLQVRKIHLRSFAPILWQTTWDWQLLYNTPETSTLHWTRPERQWRFRRRCLIATRIMRHSASISLRLTISPHRS